jgi:hypothetical protein
MKKTLLSVFFLLCLLPFALSTDSMSTYVFSGDYTAESSEKAPQSTQKQKFDYMSSILSRNTKPLGLKENLSLRKLLNQSSIKWAMRSGGRHLLN